MKPILLFLLAANFLCSDNDDFPDARTSANLIYSPKTNERTLRHNGGSATSLAETLLGMRSFN